MKHFKLGDAQVQQAIANFISEARQCSRTDYEDGQGGVLGLAAMSTILACVVAVGEVLLEDERDRGKTQATVRAFYRQMVDKTSWLKPPVGTDHSEEHAIKLLVEYRDGLLHALGRPPWGMLSAHQPADVQAREHKELWQLVVPDFIDAVEETVERLVADPEKARYAWNPEAEKRGIDREPVKKEIWNTL
jgi:hypothetical protein